MQSRLLCGVKDSDDWTKIEDKALRKTVQNRLAQRKRRSKITSSNTTKIRSRELPIRRQQSVNEGDNKSRVEGHCHGSQSIGPLQLDESLPEFSDDAKLSHKIGYSGSDLSDHLGFECSNSIRPFNSVFTEYLATAFSSGLVEHRIIQLPQYSILRAYVSNASVLSMAMSLFLDDNALSPYTLFSPFPMSATAPTHSLSPTDLQLSTFHHPYIDVVASPSLRNNILAAPLSEEQEDMLCMDLHCNGFTVWGSQPWSAMSWEASQDFASRWSCLMDQDTIRYSNFWRAERGEPPLRLDSNGFVAA